MKSFVVFAAVLAISSAALINSGLVPPVVSGVNGVTASGSKAGSDAVKNAGNDVGAVTGIADIILNGPSGKLISNLLSVAFSDEELCALSAAVAGAAGTVEVAGDDTTKLAVDATSTGAHAVDGAADAADEIVKGTGNLEAEPITAIPAKTSDSTDHVAHSARLLAKVIKGNAKCAQSA